MIKQVLIIATAALALTAVSAQAGSCSDDQESTAGMLAAGVAKAAVSKVVPVTGKQMVNVESCDFHGNAYNVDYKYNFLAADGLYWVEASSKFNADGSGASTRISKTSPNMAAAEAKSGVKLASN
ncbi:hypothetical protein [Asticcacaulis sp. EMRT-3]|uniref:hypothetical protein n=1 Tax=Asticcacaulis sp. EMRT-3 TaxID=3040349 RepID=UPI0024AF1AC7|nr:hypothetical protein [Asticcacaulis sp. EMRT-3]MDI7776276.1 hypothetical protein [Asticcacaulis sp. EMRT-3]